MKRTLRGDPSLFKWVEELSHEKAIDAMLQVAFCWDVYGLPDGTRNPTHGGGDFHATMAPSEPDVNAALDAVLSDILRTEEQWLIGIPRRVGVIKSSLDARAVCSREGAAALVLPLTAFGAMFLVNELYVELKAGNKSRLPADCREFAASALPEILAWWMLGRSIRRKYNQAGKLQTLLTMLRWERTSADWYQVWANSVTQQVFILLHEFGHLAEGNPERHEVAGGNMFQFRFAGIEEEIKADTWATKRILRGIPHVYEGHQDWTAEAVMILFGAMEILRRHGYLPEVGADEIVERAYHVYRRLDPFLGPTLPRKYHDHLFATIERLFLEPRSE